MRRTHGHLPPRTADRLGIVGLTIAALACAGAIVGLQTAEGATGEDPPDMQTIIPLNSFSIVDGPSGPEFRYTHHTYNAGPGPLQIQPEYNPASGLYDGRQQTYVYNNGWQLASTRKLPDTFFFHAEHGHFHFPLASFGLYAVAPDGGPGAPIVVSPKNGFCIADSFILDFSVPHAGQTAVQPGSCADPTSMRGMSVSGVDEYDYRDPGQSIPFTGVPDGTYWFRGMTDPNNDIAEINEANNETDVLVTVSTQGTNRVVTAGEVRHPDTTPPPITLSSPSDGASLSGPVTLQADAAAGMTVQYLVDGIVVGTSAATAPPYALTWNTGSVLDGEHWIAARTTDALGRTNTTDAAAVQVTSGTPTSTPPATSTTPSPAPGPLAVLGQSSLDSSSTGGPTLSNVPAGALLLAFVAADGPATAGTQTSTVTGSGLTWSLVKRSNTASGTAEVWRAWTASAMPTVQSTVALGRPGFRQSVELVALTGAQGIGAVGGASATTGAPATTLTTSAAGGWIWGVGNDWDGAVARTPRAGQVISHQLVDNQIGDTFWMQNVGSPTPATGTAVTFGDTAPTNHQWNLAALEVVPAGVSPTSPTSSTTSTAPTSPTSSSSSTLPTSPTSATSPAGDVQVPTVSITDPQNGATVGGILLIGAIAADNVGVTSVQFKLDGTNLGAPVTAPPFATTWDTRTATAGTHSLSAEARDAAGNVGTTVTPVVVTVDNTAAPPAVISVDRSVVIKARGKLTSPTLSTTVAGETVLAFVAYDGPVTAGAQRSTVTGGGLTWTLVKRTSAQLGVSEIWSAKATGLLSNARIVATPTINGYDGMLDVVAFKNANGTGVAASSAAPTGAPDVYLPGVATGSWVWAVGNDWDGATARAPVSGQVLHNQWIDTPVGDTLWVQMIAGPNTGPPGLVTVHDNAPTNHQWNYTAVEVKAAPAG